MAAARAAPDAVGGELAAPAEVEPRRRARGDSGQGVLRLDQVDLPDQRLDPGGLDHPLDEFTATAIRGYLAFRNNRWPTTTSPYLLVTRKTAHTGEPVSRFWMNRLFRVLPVTAEQLRDDRIIEEALSGRADPLHLAAVFGFGPRTGLRYAQAARDPAAQPDPAE